jgi:hypothetical protein
VWTPGCAADDAEESVDPIVGDWRGAGGSYGPMWRHQWVELELKSNGTASARSQVYCPADSDAYLVLDFDGTWKVKTDGTYEVHVVCFEANCLCVPDIRIVCELTQDGDVLRCLDVYKNQPNFARA